MNYSITQLREMFAKSPDGLIKLLNNPNATTKILSSGVEILGEDSKNEILVIPIFRKLLKHINATVRESTVIAISSFYLEKLPPNDILERLISISESDPSYDLRDFTKSVLDDFKGFK